MSVDLTAKPYWVDVVVDVPLFFRLTYRSDVPLEAGTRVIVPFRERKVCGVVWGATDHIDVAVDKIKPISQVFAEPPLSQAWRELVGFTARYYHYPLGQTAFAALPHGLRQTKEIIRRLPEQYFSLTEKGLAQTAPALAHKQKFALWQALFEGEKSRTELHQISNQSAKYLNAWQEQEWVAVREASSGSPTVSKHVLNDAQQNAVNEVLSSQVPPKFAPFLLYGITGSGKTEVYFTVMAEVLAKGKQVLFLLPEISLTPQLLARVRERFGAISTVILHSQMSEGERTQNFLDAAENKAQLVIGTRLSVFTPIPELGLIVVDEEHDGSFKQEDELRYHARDLALWRAKQANCPIILGSATPSLESYQNARQGKYTLLTLNERANSAATLPDIYLDNVSKQKLDNGFAPLAIKTLQKNFEQGGLSLVYLNRRGFAPALVCTDCGYSFGCPNCSARMVVHRLSKNLRCHHCNYTQSIAHSCSSCGNQDLSALGQGTQRIEETLAAILPNAKIVRVDRDSTSKKNDWENLYRQVENNEVDVLVGTQMLSKGHDFANLNLVVVLNVDGSLYSPDFRSPERLFSELMQVSGRSGRATKKGRVLIQTQLPDHTVFQALMAQSYPQFAEEELAMRAQFGFSPFKYSVAIKADALNVSQAMSFLAQVKESMVLPENIQVLGPAPAFMLRLASRERAQLFLESTSRAVLHQALDSIQAALSEYAKGYRDLRFAIDVDPLTS